MISPSASEVKRFSLWPLVCGKSNKRESVIKITEICMGNRTKQICQHCAIVNRRSIAALVKSVSRVVLKELTRLNFNALPPQRTCLKEVPS